ncbi:MAG: serine hydrolase, partial [Anaerolineales bacterium]
FAPWRRGGDALPPPEGAAVLIALPAHGSGPCGPSQAAASIKLGAAPDGADLGTAIDVKGTLEPGFARLRDGFARNFEDLNETGAAVCVYHHGRKVVDLWAGVAGSPASAEWTEDTLAIVFSTTMGATAVTAFT